MKARDGALLISIVLSACGGRVVLSNESGSDGRPAGASSSGEGNATGAGASNPCASSNATLLVSSPEPPRSVVSDGTTVYWTTWGEGADQTNGRVLSAPIAGGSATVLAESNGITTDIAVDANDVYWLDYGDHVRKAPKAGGTPVSLASPPGIGNSTSFAIDATSVYASSPDGVWSTPFAEAPPLFLVSANAELSIAVDDAHVYWLEPTSIARVPKTGGAADVVASFAMGSNESTSLAVDATSVYMLSTNGGTIVKFPKSGGAPTVLVSGLRCPSALRLDGSDLFFADDAIACDMQPDDFAARSIKRVSTLGGVPSIIGDASITGVAGVIGIDARNVYWTGGSNIYCAAR